MTTAEWYTPDYIVEPARRVLGTIDLDPASSRQANRTVKAKKFFDAATDGLEQDWFGNVFVNAPGGKRAGESLPLAFWRHLVWHYDECYVKGAIWVGYSLEQLQSFQKPNLRGPLMFPICIPKRRIPFVGKGTSPTHANYIAYLGSDPEKFKAYFSDIGEVRL